MQEKYKAMLEKMQTELRRKQLFIEELKNRVILMIHYKSNGKGTCYTMTESISA